MTNKIIRCNDGNGIRQRFFNQNELLKKRKTMETFFVFIVSILDLSLDYEGRNFRKSH